MVKLSAGLAPAKINLFLRVVRRRPDGYHELDSAFLPVALYDQVTLEVREAPRCSAALETDEPAVPVDERNHAVKAALAFMAEFDVRAQVTIGLEKKIPVGAGLGGGSSDAGAVLSMMAGLCRVEAGSRLERVALRVGADVPFFLNPRPARVGGIGETITLLSGAPHLDLLIAVPPFAVSTAEIYQALSPEQHSGRAPDEVVGAIEAGEVSRAMLVNDLAATACERHPEIGRLKDLLEALGARGASMTGSGGAVFAIFSSKAQANRAAEQARKKAPHARFIVTTTIP